MKKPILICLGLILLVGACVAISDNDDSTKKTDNLASTESPVAPSDTSSIIDESTTVTEQLPEIKKSDWVYNESIDEMTDKISYTATVVSENSVDFDFPYQGGSTLQFTLRNDPQYGRDAYIRISSGQFNTSYNGTKIKLRIDDNEAKTIYCNEASDGSQDVLFLNGYDKIVKALKGAKTMKISAEFFSEGTRTFTFNVEGLEWNH